LQNAEIEGQTSYRLLSQGCENFPSPIPGQLTAFFDSDFSQLLYQLMEDPAQMEDFQSQ
jgi:hypothetical protein